MACYHLPDEFEDIFPVGTRLIMSSRTSGKKEGNLRARVVSFNPGKGPYSNPEVKYDSKKYPHYSDEDMSTYTLSYSGGSDTDTRSEKLGMSNCVDVHSTFIVMP